MTLLPKRITEEQISKFKQWPREYRLVFALIDGNRTSLHIASLLRWPPERVVEVLHELHARRFIGL
jgi:hypothetical protein